MSKYIYTTIYEQFTGLKPPEPKNHKPRRRRGYGHPYRMRLNMQEDVQQESLEGSNEQPEDYSDQSNPVLSQAHQYQASYDAIERRSHRSYRPISTHPARPSQNSAQFSSYEPDPRETHASSPKVTYKKRRRYSESGF